MAGSGIASETETVARALPESWGSPTIIVKDDGTIVVQLSAWEPDTGEVLNRVTRSFAKAHGRIAPVTVEIVPPENPMLFPDAAYGAVGVADLRVGDAVNWEGSPWRVKSVKELTLNETLTMWERVGALTREVEQRWAAEYESGVVAIAVAIEPLWSDASDKVVVVSKGSGNEVFLRLDSSGRWPECSDCGLLWPCPDEISARQAGIPVSDL